MKTQNVITCATGIFSVAALMLVSTPLMAQPAPPPPPPVPAPTAPPIAPPPPSSIQAPPTVVPSPGAPPAIPPPGVAVNVGVPDSYVWDGQEYVGVVGDQYYYLGPNNVWMPLNSDRKARFHDWAREHQDWREHAIRNERYRLDSHGKEHPLHEHDADQHMEHNDHD